MSLFGAATSGVDPTTGSYLSKEQRVAMFRASRGQGGSGSGAGNGGARRATVAAGSIVVAKKMTSVIQKLQYNHQQTVDAVNTQVSENKKNIENLYNEVAADRAREAKQEKQETKLLQSASEDKKRSKREALVEGIGKAVGAVGAAAGAVVRGTTSLVGNIFGRLKNALLLLAGAWVVDNLPELISGLENFLEELPDLKDNFINSLGDIRGVWSILDNLLGGVKRVLGKIIGTAGRVARFIFNKVGDIIGKIFRPIKNFFGRVINGTLRKLGSWFGKQLGRISELIKPKVPKFTSPDTPKLPPGSKGADGSAKGSKGLMGWFQRQGTKLTNFGKNMMGKGKDALTGAFDGARTSISKSLQGMSESMTGVKPRTDGVRANWLSKALSPIGKAYPALKGALGGVLKLAKGVLKIVPGIGFAIDLALNKGVAGQDWTEAIIRALGSSIVGGLSAAAGAKAGGLAGAAVGAAFAGVGAIPGAAIGAALGGIIAGMVGGAGGDMLGKGINSFVGGTNTDNKVMGTGIIESFTDENKKLNVSESIDSTTQRVDFKLPKGGSSTPDGMQSMDNVGSEFNIQTIDLGQRITQMKPDMPSSGDMFDASQIANFSSGDDEMDIYRLFSEKEYQLTIPVAS